MLDMFNLMLKYNSGIFNNSNFVFACCYIVLENVPDFKSKTLTRMGSGRAQPKEAT